VKALIAILLCLRGTIFLYQGEELGLPDAHVPFERLRDPFAIASYAGESGRDGARTPMPWTAEGPSAGYSSAEDSWLPVDPAHRPLAATAQEADPTSILNFARRAIALRRASAALRIGAATPAPAPEGVLAFERREAKEHLLCLFDLAGAGAFVTLPSPGRLIFTVTGDEQLRGETLRLPAFGGAILRLDGSAA
jgi:alpha-glucosidase